MIEFDDLKVKIEQANSYREAWKLALLIALGFWRDYRRANGLNE